MKQNEHKCGCCGDPVSRDEGYYLEGYKQDVCSECYEDKTDTCQICGEDIQRSDRSEFILCKAELSTTADCPPGIFRIRDYPFLMIGSLCRNDVIFVDRLPKPDREFEISGHLCLECAKPYAQTFERVYAFRPELGHLCRQYKGCKGKQAKWMAVLGSTKEGREIEKQHTRKTILANPDMLRDLECDSVDRDAWGDDLSYANANDWNDLRERYDLPDGLPTYHEWRLIKRKGVSVFACYGYDLYDGPFSGWLSVRPEPRFRSGAGILIQTFSVGSLPTFPRDEFGFNQPDDPNKYRPSVDAVQAKFGRKAIIDAIDQGILTSDGVVENGKLIYAR